MIKKRTINNFVITLTTVFSATVFLFLLTIAVSGGKLNYDESVLLWFYKFRSGWLSFIFQIITNSVSYYAPLPILLITVFLWRRGERLSLLLPFGSIAIFPLTAFFLKNLFMRERPSIVPPLVIEHSSSFPSGHTLTAMGLYGLIALLLWRRGKKIPAVFSALWVLMVAASRLYLGVHYPSDVLASLMLGTVLLVTFLLIDRILE